MPGEDAPSRRRTMNPATSSRAGMSLAALALALDHGVLTRPFDDWVREPDVSARFVHFDDDDYLRRLQRADAESLRHAASPVKSASLSSMARTLLHQSDPSTHNPPSLRSCYTDATPTESSISTDLVSHFPGIQLLQDNNGILEIPRTHPTTPVYECVFWFLDCDYISQNKEEWETHCSSHFRGEEPPRTVQCPLCDWAATCDAGQQAWTMRMKHLALEHVMRGQTLRTSRPDFGLFQYLWQRRLIDDADLKELRGGNHNLTLAPANFVVTNGRGREGNGARRVPGTQHVRAPRRLDPWR